MAGGRGQVGPSGRDAANRQLDQARRALDTTVMPAPPRPGELGPTMPPDRIEPVAKPVVEERPPVVKPTPIPEPPRDRTDVIASGFGGSRDRPVDLGPDISDESPRFTPPPEPPRSAYADFEPVLRDPEARDPPFVAEARSEPVVAPASPIQAWADGVFERCNFASDSYKAAIVKFAEAARKAGYGDELIQLALETSINFYSRGGRSYINNSNLFDKNKPHKFNEKFMKQLKAYGVSRGERAVELLKQKLSAEYESEFTVRFYLPRFFTVMLAASERKGFKPSDEQVVDWLMTSGRSGSGFSSIMFKSDRKILNAIEESLKPKPEPKKVEPPKMGEKTVSTTFGLPGTKRKIASGCYLEYRGARDGEYTFVLHKPGARQDPFTIKLGESYTSTVKVKGVDVTLSMTLNSHNDKTSATPP